MIDGIIKADGTSRLARSVADFQARYPTYDAFAKALVAGTLPLDILFNAAGWSQVPDFLNKSNLLKDTTAAKFGLSSEAVLDDAFAAAKSLIDTKAKIATGTYVGTATNSVSIKMDFTPKFVVVFYTTDVNGSVDISSSGLSGYHLPLILSPGTQLQMNAVGKYKNSAGYLLSGSSNNVKFTVTFNNGIAWSVPNSVTSGGTAYYLDYSGYDHIKNQSGYVYSYIAIG